MGLFKSANETVVLSAGRQIEAKNLGPITTPNGPPTGPTDGVNLQTSPTVYYAVKARTGGQTVSVVLHAYTEALGGWYAIPGGIFANIGTTGQTDRLNLGAYTRFYIQVTSVGTGGADVYMARAI